jgi:UDPglucose 6-dehydrogenase
LNKRKLKVDFDVVSNPEFLKEGAAIDDFMKPDRVIIGTESDRAKSLMHQLYAPFNRNHERTIFMGIRDAEMTKYAANSMLATKISFINEISNICELMGVDVENVRRGIGSDDRIGFSFIYPGCGYGGSCFPKDVQALIRMAQDVNFEPEVLLSVESCNQYEPDYIRNKGFEYFGVGRLDCK